MTAPAQSYSIIFSAFLALTGQTVRAGYAVTRCVDGPREASTTNLAISLSGTYDGIALELGNPGDSIQVQQDAEVAPGVIPWLGTGSAENAVVDANGKVQRASVASGTVIGTVTKDGGVKLTPTGATGGTLGGDVTGPAVSNTVVKIQGRAVSSAVPSAGNTLVWDGSAWSPTAISFAAGGDLSGTLSSATVIKLQGRSVSSSAPSSGNALVWDGSAWSPGAAGSTITWANDLAGSSDSSQKVVALTGNGSGLVQVRGTAALAFTTGTVASAGDIRFAADGGSDKVRMATYVDAFTTAMPMVTTNGTTVTYGDGAATTATLRGQTARLITSGTSVVADGTNLTIDNASAAIFNTALIQLRNNIKWEETASAPQLSQDTLTSNAAPQNLALKPQAPISSATGNNRIPGSLIVDIAAPTNGGTTEGGLQYKRAGTLYATLSASATLGASLAMPAKTSDAAPLPLTIKAQSAWTGAATNVTGGTLVLAAGDNSGAEAALSGRIEFWASDTASTSSRRVAYWAGSSPYLLWDKAMTSARIAQDDITTAGLSPSAFTIQAQGRSGSADNGTGGDVNINGGSGKSAANGNVVLNSIVTVTPSALQLTLSTATTATGGARTLPANPVDFLIVTINGTARKIPFYAT